MSPIRILISDLPQLLSEIVINIVDSQHDMQIVDAPLREAGLMTALERSDADVLVLGCEESELRQRGDVLLKSRPSLKIVALDGDGKHSYFYGLQPQLVALGEVSPQLLVEAIRDAVGPASQHQAKET